MKITKGFYIIIVVIIMLMCFCACGTNTAVNTGTSTPAGTVPPKTLEKNNSNYDLWLDAELSEPGREKYENIIMGLEIADEEISRGWFDDSTILLIKLIKGDTIYENASNSEYMDVYKSLGEKIDGAKYSIRDFFTTDKNGNSTPNGIYNFFDVIDQLEDEKFDGNDIVHIGEDGRYRIDLDIVGGRNVIAKELGISEEIVSILWDASFDAGFE